MRKSEGCAFWEVDGMSDEHRQAKRVDAVLAQLIPQQERALPAAAAVGRARPERSGGDPPEVANMIRGAARIQADQTFETTDLCLASYLVAACGLRLWACKACSPERVTFVLTPRPDPADLAHYDSGQATVLARSFFRVLRSLEREMQKAGEE